MEAPDDAAALGGSSRRLQSTMILLELLSISRENSSPSELCHEPAVARLVDEVSVTSPAVEGKVVVVMECELFHVSELLLLLLLLLCPEVLTNRLLKPLFLRRGTRGRVEQCSS